jgi:NTP pyrophosphatase (non-canonical NTP hydrolase)
VQEKGWRVIGAAMNQMEIRDFQALIEKMYSDKDRARGTPATFLWLMEEIGELATALREGTQDEKNGEFADVVAWLVTLANINDIDLTAALQAKYGKGCPGCRKLVCICNSKP